MPTRFLWFGDQRLGCLGIDSIVVLWISPKKKFYIFIIHLLSDGDMEREGTHEEGWEGGQEWISEL